MNKLLKNKKFIKNNLIVFIALCITVVSFNGCEPLRKKFTRKKKDGDKKVKFDPVLDPIDYEPINKTSEDRYAYHYSLWKVWSRELIKSTTEGQSSKRQKYFYSQMTTQLQEMNNWIVGEKKELLKQIIEDYKNVDIELSKPEPIQRTIFIKNKLRINSKKVKNNLNPKFSLEYK